MRWVSSSRVAPAAGAPAPALKLPCCSQLTFCSPLLQVVVLPDRTRRAPVEAFRQALIALHGDAARRAAMGAAARLRVAERYSVDRMVREYLAVYQDVMGRRGSAVSTDEEKRSR